MRLTELLTEGPNDPNRLKAVFMAGGPGSGKTHVARKLLGDSGLKHVNIDDFYEFLRKNRVTSGGYDKELYDYSWNLLRKRMKLYLDGRLGVIIDITGRRLDRLLKTKEELEELGYDTMAVVVNTDLGKALDRNEMRARKVDPEVLKRIHSEVQQNLGKIQQIFKGQALFVDNTQDKQDFTHERKVVDKFLAAPNRNRVNEDWQDEQRNARAKMQQKRNDDIDIIAEQYKEVTKQVIESCQPWFQANGSPLTVAYRGLRGNQDVVMPSKGEYRTNRAPTDSPKILHRLFDIAIEEAGLVANRSNSIFITGEKTFAKKYGAVYVVFPIGEFNYSWSPHAKDWFMAYHNARADDFVTVESLSKFTYDWFLQLAKQDSEFERVLGSWSDDKIVDHFIKYKANVNMLRADDLDAKVIDVKRLIQTVKGDDGSLWQALKSGNEIMLSAKGGYLYVPEMFYWKYMDHYLSAAGIKTH